MRGSEFIKQWTGKPRAEREADVLELAKKGELFFFPLIPVDFQGGRIFVWSDYLSVGEDGDWVRMPVGGQFAQAIADELGLLLPTKKMVDLIYKAAANKVPADPWGEPYDSSMYSMERIAAHHERIEAKRDKIGRAAGIVAGHKKDVVLTNLLEGKPDRVAIYGWFRSDGSVIQGPCPNAKSHELSYADYSHGIRFVSPDMTLGGSSAKVLEVLSDPVSCSLLSDEGPLKVKRYPLPASTVSSTAPTEPPPASTPSAFPVLRKGSQGVYVERWQKIIGVTADGSFGPNTEAKTKTWQSANGLTADGVVGAQSWAKGCLQESKTVPNEAKASSFKFIQAKNYRPGRRVPIAHIVIHTMEAPEKPETAENVASWFGGKYAPQSSAHYCIDADSVVQCVKDTDTAFHAPGANASGIGLEHAGYASQKEDGWNDSYTQSMLELSAELTAELCYKYKIPAVHLTPADLAAGKPGIVGHADCTKAFGTKGGHMDPGPNFPWDDYIAKVQAALSAKL